eukprot:671440-Pelagomonas_calceolata.AAC.1
MGLRQKNYLGRENSPYINCGKGDTLALRAVSLLHQRVRGKLVWVRSVSGSMWNRKRKSYVGSENTSYINQGKRDTLAQRAVSLPNRKTRGELMWIGW